MTFIVDKNNRNKNEFVPIKANITINYQNVKKIVDYVLPIDWNRNQQRERPLRSGKINNYEIVNEILEKLQKGFDLFTKRCEQNRIKLTSDIAKFYLMEKGIYLKKYFDRHIKNFQELEKEDCYFLN